MASREAPARHFLKHETCHDMSVDGTQSWQNPDV